MTHMVTKPRPAGTAQLLHQVLVVASGVMIFCGAVCLEQSAGSSDITVSTAPIMIGLVSWWAVHRSWARLHREHKNS